MGSRTGRHDAQSSCPNVEVKRLLDDESAGLRDNDGFTTECASSCMLFATANNPGLINKTL